MAFSTIAPPYGYFRDLVKYSEISLLRAPLDEILSSVFSSPIGEIGKEKVEMIDSRAAHNAFNSIVSIGFSSAIFILRFTVKQFSID